MKNVLMKFAGLFVERVPVDERGNPLPTAPRPKGAPAATPGAPPQPGAGQPGRQPQQQQPPPPPPPHGQHPGQPMQPAQGMPPGTQPMYPPAQPGQQHGVPYGVPQQAVAVPGAGAAPAAALVSVALRAWVPEEYAAHLAPFGVHVIAAGGSVSSEQARGWGADVLVISAECLGQDIHLLQQPQLPTVFITPQAMMIPDVPGVVQVQEPLRASDVAQAARDAAAAFAAARSH